MKNQEKKDNKNKDETRVEVEQENYSLLNQQSVNEQENKPDEQENYSLLNQESVNEQENKPDETQNEILYFNLEIANELAYYSN